MIMDKKPNTVNFRNKYGETPLHKAMWEGNLACVVLLIQNGADFTLVNNSGVSPLQLITGNSQSEEIIKYLCQRGIDMGIFLRSVVTLVFLIISSRAWAFFHALCCKAGAV
jgi:ankyrin repeat protein